MSRTHPEDEAIFALNSGLTALEIYLAADGDYSASDQAIVAQLRHPVVNIETFRRREDAGEAFARNGMTDHTIRLFHRAGHRPEDMRRHHLRVIQGGKHDLDDAA